MRTRCPSCGTTLSLDALVAHDGAREALAAVFKLSGVLGSALIRYIALFRPAARELTMDRVARLIVELQPDLQAQRITRGGQVFEAPIEAWLWAIDQAVAARDEGRLTVPLKGHGWLYEVISRWRPSNSTAVLASPATVILGTPKSRTLAGIAALEGFKHGQ